MNWDDFGLGFVAGFIFCGASIVLMLHLFGA